MRVALVSIGDPRNVKVWSGIPHSILEELELQTDSVEVIAPLNRWFRYLYAVAVWWNGRAGKPYQFDRHPIAVRSYARQIARRLRGKDFDLIVSTSSVAIAALQTAVPIVYWTDAVLEGMLGYYSAFAGFSKGEIAIGHAQEQAALQRCAFAMYASQWAIKSVQSHYEGIEGKLALFRFGANLKIEHGVAEIERLVKMRRTSPVVLLFIGVDWERKGGPIALEATRLLNERGIPAVLRVVGCAAPAMNHVENLGFVSKGTTEGRIRVKQLLAEATIFLFPTRAEAAGCVFAEASAFGLPILATDTGGVTDYVENGTNGFTLPLAAGAAEYAEKLVEMLRDGELYERLSYGAFARYEQLLNWKVGVREMLNRVQKS